MLNGRTCPSRLGSIFVNFSVIFNFVFKFTLFGLCLTHLLVTVRFLSNVRNCPFSNFAIMSFAISSKRCHFALSTTCAMPDMRIGPVESVIPDRRSNRNVLWPIQINMANATQKTQERKLKRRVKQNGATNQHQQTTSRNMQEKRTPKNTANAR